MADRRLQIFHAVARYKSFTRAADALFMTQPTVTLQIKHLESQYNTRLIDRHPGGLQLTRAGELVYAYAQRILALDEEMEARLAEMTGELRGTLSVGAVSSVADDLLPAIFAEFNALYPQVHLCLHTANSTEISRQVLAQSLDIGLIEMAPVEPALVGEHCGDGEMRVICAPDYPLDGADGVKAADLLEYEFISREPGSAVRKLTEAYLAEAGCDGTALKAQMALGSVPALKQVLADGLGLSVMPDFSVRREVASGVLRSVALDPALLRPVYLIYLQDRFRTLLAETFSNFVRSKLRDLKL